MTLTEGQISDDKEAALLLATLPKAKELLADRGYDAHWFRDALRARGITPRIPGKETRKAPLDYDKTIYKQRYKVEIMFSRIKGLSYCPAPRPLLPPPSFSILTHKA